MKVDISKWCCSSLVCVTRQAGRVVQLPLPQILAYGPFHRVGVDVIQFPKSILEIDTELYLLII